MTYLWYNVRLALRFLRRNLSVTLVAVASLGLAIAGNAVVFSVINGLLYRSLPFSDPAQLSLVGEHARDLQGSGIDLASLPNFLDWQERATVFDDLAAFRQIKPGLDSGEAEPEPITGGAVTPSFFDALGVQPRIGRPFSPESTVPGNDRLVILSHGFWLDRFGGREGIVGETLELDGLPYEVVGVMGDDFEFLVPTDVLTPLAIDRSTFDRTRRDVLVIGRRAAGVTNEAAQAEVSGLMEGMVREHPTANRGYTARVLQFREAFPDARNRALMKLLLGAMIFVLFLACANVANLQLARSERRSRAMAIRASLGASRWRMVGLVITENLTLAFIAGIVGLVIALGGMKVLASALAAAVPRYALPVMDARVLVFSLAITLIGGLFFGLAPAVQVFTGAPLSSLKDAGRGTTPSHRRRWLAMMLVAGEVALSLVLLGGAGVLLKSFEILQSSDPGFRTENLLTAQLQLPEGRYATDAERIAAVDGLTARLSALPGVTGATASNVLPRTPATPRDILTVDGQSVPADRPPPRALWLTVDGAYFETLGIPVKEGRPISATDRADSAPVAVINEALAQRFWGSVDPLGKRLTIRGRTWDVVGVVGDVRHALVIDDKVSPTVYLPWTQSPGPSVSFALRTGVDASGLASAVRNEIRAYDGHLAVGDIQTLDAYVARFWVGQRAITVLLDGFGILALLLAAIGTHGVLGYTVAQRTHEIGVRMAFGARRSQVLWMVVRRALVISAFGLVVGLAGVALVTRGLSAALAGLVPVEVGAVVGAVLVLVVVTAVASLLPARRAASVDPSAALRWE